MSIACPRKLTQSFPKHTKSNLLKCDLLIVRDALFHFSQTNVKIAINNIKKNNPKYILTTELENKSHINRNIEDGDWYPIALQNPPYNFPKPIFQIKEDDPNKFLSLWAVKDLPYFNLISSRRYV